MTILKLVPKMTISKAVFQNAILTMRFENGVLKRYYIGVCEKLKLKL